MGEGRLVSAKQVIAGANLSSFASDSLSVFLMRYRLSAEALLSDR